jgi:hypothetical protein
MTSRFFLALIVLLCGLSACKTLTSIEVPEGLRTDTVVMDVTGRQGWQVNQTIRFGEYGSSKIKRGWAQTRSGALEIGFAARFKSAKQKLSFNLYGPDTQSAQLLAVSRFERNEVELLKGYLSATTHYANTFAGSVKTGEGREEWEFLVNNPEDGSPADTDTGRLHTPSGREILIRGVKRPEGYADRPAGFYNYGFEFVQDGRSVGAVSLLGKGRVWLHQSLDADTRLVLASVATALMVRTSLKD